MPYGEKNTWRHVGRTHAISVRWLNEQVSRGETPTDKMAASIFTKHYADRKRAVWEGVKKRSGVFRKEDIVGHVGGRVRVGSS